MTEMISILCLCTLLRFFQRILCYEEQSFHDLFLRTLCKISDTDTGIYSCI